MVAPFVFVLVAPFPLCNVIKSIPLPLPPLRGTDVYDGDVAADDAPPFDTMTSDEDDAVPAPVSYPIGVNAGGAVARRLTEGEEGPDSGRPETAASARSMSSGPGCSCR